LAQVREAAARVPAPLAHQLRVLPLVLRVRKELRPEVELPRQGAVLPVRAVRPQQVKAPLRAKQPAQVAEAAAEADSGLLLNQASIASNLL
jgi:hypothetical protein